MGFDPVLDQVSTSFYGGGAETLPVKGH